MDVVKSYSEIFKQGICFDLDKLFDCCLRSEDGLEFGAHRVILASRCDYFRGIFSGNFGTETKVNLSGISGSILCEILRFLYTGSLTLNEDNIIDIIVSADYFLIDKLLNKCRIYALKHINVNNCLMYFEVAWFVERFSFLTECFRFIQTHFESVVSSHDSNFADLPISFVKKFLNLNGVTEDVIWMAAVTWLKKDPVGRQQVLPELLACLCLQNLDEPLATEILENPLLKEYLLNSICCKNYETNLSTEFPNKAKNNYNSEKLKSLVVKSKIIYGFDLQTSQTRLPKNLFLLFSESQFSFQKKFYITFDELHDIWQEIDETPIWPQALVPIGSRVYMFDKFENKILALNLEDKSWTQLNPMNIPRNEYSVVDIGLSIYVLGGTTFSSHVHTSLVEKYNYLTGLWEVVSSMNHMNCGFAIGAENAIYAVGVMQNDRGFEMIAQVYDPQQDTWSLINAPNIYRNNFALVSLRGKIYILGGTNNGEYLRSVEEYDIEGDTWKPFADLPLPYYSPKATIFKDMILVYDAVSKGNYSPYPPSYWDKKSKNWQLWDLVSLTMYKFCTIKDEDTIKNFVRKNNDSGIKWKKSHFAN
ncbi:kelch-like protein 28 [Stegodyphus dumicola]|uniref:kelch-like protein 28 n=1 Tax=Stegodyphus dumicola TaxID=202533 RepID=UPI0015A8A400|nr:kelch-like protein 28 [Stegodyphus dumicola]